MVIICGGSIKHLYHNLESRDTIGFSDGRGPMSILFALTFFVDWCRPTVFLSLISFVNNSFTYHEYDKSGFFSERY